ncbi:hypothetical protein, partial [Wolbachia pipientis]|uniref:hypothetical protein n=1 Tax=Wolbachia pipientis TaxID=955 RepID=UPI0021C17D96
MFPVEMSNIVQKILSNSAANWNIIVASTKSGGYRQLVTQNDKIVFTTLLTSTNDTLPGIIAGKIYQEIKNTVKSLSKFGFKSGDLVDLCIIVQEDIKTSLSVIDFAENSISIFTPYELNKLLKLGLAITEKDKFCDTVVLFHSFKNQPVSLFNTKKTKELYLLNALYLHSSKFFLFLILILIFINAVCVLNLSSNIHITDHLIIKEQCLNDQLIALEQGYPIKEVNEIYDFININNVLSKIEYSPLTQVQYVEKLRTSDTELRTFEWYYDEINNSIVTKLKFYLKHGTDGYRKLQNRLNSNFRTQTVNIYSPPLLEEKQDVAVYINIEEKT